MSSSCYDNWEQNPDYHLGLMRDKLGIACEDDFADNHADWIATFAEANDKLGTLQGWVFSKEFICAFGKHWTRIPVIEFVFEFGIVTTDYELTVLMQRAITRIDQT